MEPSRGYLVSQAIFSRTSGWTRTGAAGIRQHIECVVQGEILSFDGDTPKTSTVSPGAVKPAKTTGDGDQRMGSALRSVYQKTVDEAVPDEMLALLGKLD